MDNLKQQAYNIIKEKILWCEYAPNSYLSEKMLIDATGMSRTPVRDALSRLEQEGLLQIQPKIGIWVSGLTFRDVNHLFEFRRLLELYAMKNYAHKIEKSGLRDIYRRMEENSMEDAKHEYELDDEFHDLLINSTENDYVIRAYVSMKNQIHRLRILTGQYQGKNSRITFSRQEHAVIMEAMLQGEYEKAADALAVHLSNSYNSVVSILLEDCPIDVLSLTGRKTDEKKPDGQKHGR